MLSPRQIGSVGLLSEPSLIGPLPDSSYRSGVYDHVFLPSISLIGVNGDLIPPAGDTAFFEAILSITVRSRDADPDGTS